MLSWGSAQAMTERYPQEFAGGRWQPLLQFLASNPDIQRLRRAMGPRITSFDPAAAATPRAVRARDSCCLWSTELPRVISTYRLNVLFHGPKPSGRSLGFRDYTFLSG